MIYWYALFLIDCSNFHKILSTDHSPGLEPFSSFWMYSNQNDNQIIDCLHYWFVLKEIPCSNNRMCVCIKWSLIHLFFSVLSLLQYHYSFKIVCYKHAVVVNQVVVNGFILFLLFKSLCCLKICYMQFCSMGKLVVILCWFCLFWYAMTKLWMRYMCPCLYVSPQTPTILGATFTPIYMLQTTCWCFGFLNIAVMTRIKRCCALSVLCAETSNKTSNQM